MNINLDHINPEWKTSGINLIYFGDFHHRAKAPASRIDDFEATEKLKVDQLRFLAQEFNARAFIQPGDFLDTPGISEKQMAKILDWWGYTDAESARSEYEAGKIDKLEYADKELSFVPIVGIAGNHELYGGSLRSLNRSSLSFLAKQGLVQLVDKDQPYIIKGQNGLTVAITGNHYDISINKYSSEADVSYYEQPNKYGDVDIYLTHGYLAKEKGQDPYEVLIDRVNTKADVTINGHIHSGFGWVERKGHWFGNPGAMAQQSRSELELERVIKATLIHIKDDGSFEIVDIPLDLPHPSTIFDLTANEERLKNEERMERIKSLVGSSNASGETNAGKIIEAVAEEENVSEDIRELATKEVTSKMKEMGGNEPLSPDVDYRVKSITLHNFESHQHTVIELDDTTSPTLVIGESSQGKSSILRGIYWLLDGSGDGKSFVRRKSNVREAYVEIERMDGTKVRRFIEVSIGRDTGERKPKKQGYIITHPDGTEEEYNTEGITAAQDVFGFNTLQIDHDKNGIPINFQKQEDGWYFISLTPSKRASVIGALSGTQYITAATRSLNQNQSRKKQEQNHVKEDTQTMIKDLDKLADFDNLYKEQQSIDEQLTLLQDIEVKNKRQEYIYRERHHLLKNQETLTHFVSVGEEKIPTLYSAYTDLSELAQKETQTEQLYTQQLRFKKEFMNAQKWNKVDTASLNQLYQSIEEIDNKNKTLSDLYNKRHRYTKDYQRYKQATKSDAFIQKLQTRLQQAEQDKVLEEKTTDLFNQRLKHTKVLKSHQATIKDYQIELQTLTQTLKEKQRGLFTKINYGAITVYQSGGNSMEIKQLKDRIDKIDRQVVSAKTRMETAEQEIERINEQLKELGIDPENAREEILEMREKAEKLYNELEQQLKEVEEVLGQPA